MAASEFHSRIDALWRVESARIVAALARAVRDVALAEELAHDALVAALEQWPAQGMPDNPGAWLMASARHRAIDAVRHRAMQERKAGAIAIELEAALDDAALARDEALDDPVGDDLLRLVFVACHPVLSTEARVALTLRLVGGLTTTDIARAFLVPEPTMAQRIVRAKRALSAAQVPFEVPRGDALGERLASVLEVIYLVYNEGYAATAGEDWMRPPLCEEALRLGRVLAERMPREPEVHGLLALMQLQSSRIPARTSAGGEPVLLPDQDRARWDRELVERGLSSLERAERLGGAAGPYALQAAIAACHARAASADETDWTRIAALYAALAQRAPSPVVELNRAVALSRALGPAAGLALADTLRDEPALREYPLLPTVRADLLARLGRSDEAREELARAVALTRNARERALLEARAAALDAAESART